MTGVPLPTSLRIGYRDYQVETWPSKLAQAQSAHGICDPINAAIHISEDRTGWDAANTLLHEILHAVFHVGDIDPEKDGEERIVTRVADTLIQVFRDNPALQSVLFVNPPEPSSRPAAEPPEGTTAVVGTVKKVQEPRFFREID